MIGNSIKQFDGSADDGVKWWFAQLDRGITRRKDELELWEKNEEFEDLKQWEGKHGSGDEVTVNKVGSFINTHRAAVCFRNPRAKIVPRQPSGWEKIPVPEIGPGGDAKIDEQTGQPVVRWVTRAEARENLLNDIISQPLFGLTDTISRLDKAALMGYGALMVGYRPEFSTPLEKDSDKSFTMDEDGRADFSKFVPDPVNPLIPMVDEDGEPILKRDLPAWEDWFIDWVSYKNIIIDPDGENDFMQHRWVAIEVVRKLEEVKADPLFENTKDLKGGGDWCEDSENYSKWLEGEIDTDKAKTVRLFHIYDFVKDKYVVLADGHGEYLRNEDTPDGITHSPLAFLRYDEKLGEFYSRPRVTDLALINQWYNNSRTLEHIGMKSSIRKVFVREGLLDSDNISKLESDVDMEVIEWDGAKHLYGGNVVDTFNPPPVNGSIYQASASASADFDEIAGSPEMRGKASADTATQSNNLMKGESLRNQYERVLMSNTLVVAFKKLNDSIDANMSIPRAIQIAGSDGQAFIGMVDQDMIAGDFDIEIDVKEMAPSDDMALGAQRIQLLQMAGSYPHQFSDVTRARGWCELYNIYDENFIASLVDGAQMQIQMMMIEAQPPVPNAGAPEDGAQAASQSGAGQQIPAMQGAQ